jgi:hypothetical protein
LLIAKLLGALGDTLHDGEIRLGARELRLQLAAVDLGEELAGRHDVALLDRNAQQRAADLGVDADAANGLDRTRGGEDPSRRSELRNRDLYRHREPTAPSAGSGSPPTARRRCRRFSVALARDRADGERAQHPSPREGDAAIGGATNRHSW